MVELINQCCLRPATAQDIWAIRWLVFRAFLEPTQLRWEQFWVIEKDQRILACGQLRTFEQAQELGSLVVKRAWQNQGLGTYLTRHLIQLATSPLYLECLGHQLENFYQRLGFVEANFPDIPPPLQRKFKLTSTLAKWFGLPLHIMVWK